MEEEYGTGEEKEGSKHEVLGVTCHGPLAQPLGQNKESEVTWNYYT